MLITNYFHVPLCENSFTWLFHFFKHQILELCWTMSYKFNIYFCLLILKKALDKTNANIENFRLKPSYFFKIFDF